MIYKVTKRYARGAETLIGNYKTISEAQQIVQTHLADDVLNKVIATYRIYEGMDLIEEIDQSKLKSAAATSKEEEHSQAIGSGQRFSPSPFSTKPQPKGIPISSWKDDDSSDKK